MKKLNRVEEALPFDTESKENENLEAENLLNIKDACILLNITETKLMGWVRKDLITFQRVGEITYFDKSELSIGCIKWLSCIWVCLLLMLSNAEVM